RWTTWRQRTTVFSVTWVAFVVALSTTLVSGHLPVGQNSLGSGGAGRSSGVTSSTLPSPSTHWATIGHLPLGQSALASVTLTRMTAIISRQPSSRARNRLGSFIASV